MSAPASQAAAAGWPGGPSVGWLTLPSGTGGADWAAIAPDVDSGAENDAGAALSLAVGFAGAPTPVARGDAALAARNLALAGLADPLVGEALAYQRAALRPRVRLWLDSLLLSTPMVALPDEPSGAAAAWRRVRPWDFAPGLAGGLPVAAPGLGVAWGDVAGDVYAAAGTRPHGRFWQPSPLGSADPDALALLVWPVWLADGTLEDLLAVPVTPARTALDDRWWRRTGAVDLLGRRSVDIDGDAAAPPTVRLYRHARDWLAAGAEGCPALGVPPAGLCVLDPDGDEAQRLWAAIGDGRLVALCDDVVHADEVDGRARPRRKPYRDSLRIAAA